MSKYKYNSYYEKIGNTVTCINNKLPFDIPDNWSWIRLGALIKIISGVSYNKKDISSTGIRILRGGNIYNFQINLYENDVFLPIKYYDDEKQIKKKDILIVASTGSEIAIGKAGVVSNNIDNTQIGAFLRIIRPLFNEFADYISVIFSTDYYRAHIRSCANGMNINNIKAEYITELLIPIPPTNEQIKIISQLKQHLEQLDIIEKLQKAYSNNREALKNKILNLAIQGKLVPQNENDESASVMLERIRAEKKAKLGKKYVDSYIYKGDDNCYYEHIGGKDIDITESIPFGLPNGWEWARLKEISNTQTGTTPSTSNSYNFGNYIPFIKPGDINEEKVNYYNEGLSKEGLACGRLIPTNSILMVCIGGSLGKCALIDKDVSCNQQINAATPNEGILSKYLYSVLSSDYFYKEAKTNATGTATPIINRSLWENIFIPIPPQAEQQRIVNKVNEIFSKL